MLITEKANVSFWVRKLTLLIFLGEQFKDITQLFLLLYGIINV